MKTAVNTVLVLSLFVISAISHASKELSDVKMEDQVKVGDKTLVLNGMGLRKVTKFGIPVKVYVAGLYVEKKTTDSDALVKNDEVKHLIMHFVRTVDKEPIVDGFNEGYETNCIANCDKKKEQFKLFADQLVSLRKDNEIKLTFYKDKIDIETNGPNAKKGTVMNGDLSRNMLNVFIDKTHNPGKEFQAGLMGK
jgi:hypothetical protein